MKVTKVFTSGNSQAVRLPKEFQSREKELYIQKVGNSLVLLPTKNPWKSFEESFDQFSSDYMAEGRDQPAMQKRKSL